MRGLFKVKFFDRRDFAAGPIDDRSVIAENGQHAIYRAQHKLSDQEARYWRVQSVELIGWADQ